MSIESASLPPRKRPLRLRIHTALRWLHIYLSMFCLLTVLFFSVTGITLNHPEWTFGFKEVKTTVSGSLPAGWQNDQTHAIDWLKVAEYLRAQHHLHGTVADPQSDDRGGSLAFKAPGYSADCVIQTDGNYSLEINSQGLLNVLNDFHRGRDAGKTWGWVIDLSGYFLIVVSLTGIGLLLYLKKMRTTALVTMVFGIVVLVLLLKMAA